MFEKYRPMADRLVYSFLRKLPRNVCKDDILNAALLGLWEGLCKQADHENLEAYLHIRIKGAILDELRAQDFLPRRLRDRIDAEESTAGIVRLADLSRSERKAALVVNVEEQVDTSREVQILITVLERLPARERLIMEAHYIKGVKFLDIAKELGVSDARVSQLHSRAVAMIKEMVAA